MDADEAQQRAKAANVKLRVDEARRRSATFRSEAWALLIRKQAAISIESDRYVIDMTGLTSQQKQALMHADCERELQNRLRELHAKQERERPVLTSDVVSPARKAWAAMAARHKNVFPSGPPAPMRAAAGLRNAKRLANAATLRAARAMVPETTAGIIRRDLLETHHAGSAASKPDQSGHIGRVSTIEKQAQTLAPFPGDGKAKGPSEPAAFDYRGKGPQGR